MGIEFGVWSVEGERITPVAFSPAGLEARLEEILDRDISIASPNWMIIGRQVQTAHGKRIDLLAIDGDASLVVIELKRNQTPRDVIAQLLDYGSWVRGLQTEQIAEIFQDYQRRFRNDSQERSLDDAFRERFGISEIPEEINGSHELVVVAQSLDAETERIVKYLAEEHEVGINAIFFRVFQNQGHEYLTRAWLQEPTEISVADKRPEGRIPWNGEYYVNYSRDRDWELARTHGFVSAGGEWYLKTFKSLEPGNRIWVNVPGEGYVGVGEVTAPPVPFHQFSVRDTNGRSISITQVLPKLLNHGPSPDCEHFAAVRWIQTVPVSQAVKERGFFGNQNTVVQPQSAKWAFTIERLKQRFGVAG